MSLIGFLVVSAALFTLGIVMYLSRRNAIAILMGVELILNAAALNFVAFSRFTSFPGARLDGQVFAVFIILMAAAEAVVALAIVLTVYRDLKLIQVDKLVNLQG